MVLNFVISITAKEPTILIQNDFMEHRGIHYAIRIGIQRPSRFSGMQVIGSALSAVRRVSEALDI